VWKICTRKFVPGEIIDEIKHLPPVELARVVSFLRTLDEGRQKTGQELEELAEKMAGERDPVRAQRASKKSKWRVC